jgi:hypothetical protein
MHTLNTLYAFFRIKMENIEFHSHEQQDEFVYNIFDQKEGGTFLDIACGNPLIGSNTYTLEKFKGWSGLCFDIYDIEQNYQWSSRRASKFIQIDATSEQFTDFLKENSPKIVDYISLDIDGNSVLALKRVIDSGIKFKSITFEHEFFRGDHLRSDSRKLLEDLGMVRLFSDVKYPSILPVNRDQILLAEDWWINPEFVDLDILSIEKTGEFYKDNIDILKKYKNLPYTSKHMCSQAWPDEYCLWWNQGDEQEYKIHFRNYYQK